MQPGEVPPDDAESSAIDRSNHTAPQVALSVAGAARGLGVAPATLRSWERRYGMAPSLHTPGGHRRYGPQDLARLALMNRLVQEGAPPAEAARAAISADIDAGAINAANPFAAVLAGSSPAPPAPPAPVQPLPRPDPIRDADPDESARAGSASPGGGRVLSMPRQTRSVRGLARAAMAMDTVSCQRTIQAALAEQGAQATWDDLLRPVLAAIGERWSQTSDGVEIEHGFSMVVAGALAGHSAGLARPRNIRPVLLASAPEELHDLPMLALQASLADLGVVCVILGARTPEHALSDAVARIGPPVVVLFAQMPGAQPPALPSVRPAPSVLLAGPGWVGVPAHAGRVEGLSDAVGEVCTVMGLSRS